jgi:hypothetical protein
MTQRNIERLGNIVEVWIPMAGALLALSAIVFALYVGTVAHIHTITL